MLKVEKGVGEEKNGVELMKGIDDLDESLDGGNEGDMLGSKMCCNMVEVNEEGMKDVV
ncbi:hypothetical protein [Staphylococcus epidermidis]|uniref:hypothetical protein n=1 Tax=Staphylococcus epidermidis TaxID=1282 RepID=UPI0016426C9F|nr:hypothetical protein [Staphylococcus epidermidis]